MIPGETNALYALATPHHTTPYHTTPQAIFGNIEDHLWYLVVNYSTAYMQCQLDGESRADREAAPALAPPAAVA